MEEAEKEKKAVLVYFYTDWCPYCRRLDRDLLTRVKVESTIKFFVKIKINPEKGRAENLLKTSYGVTGYPSLFVHRPGSDRPIRVRSMTRRGSDWLLSEPADFAEMLTRKVGERFTVG
jgi:thiol:disulfide interchange protein